MRAAAVQLNSTRDKARNLEVAERLVREAAADGAELVALPEKWNLLGRRGAASTGAEPLDGPTITAARGWARELGDPPARRQHRRARRGPGEAGQHLGPDRPRRRDRRRLPQDPHVRRRRRRRRLPRVRARGARARRSSSPRSASVPLGLTVCYDLRFPELYRILAVRGARVITRPVGVHAAHRPRPLGGAAAGAGDREPGLRHRAEPGRRGAAPLPLLRALDDRRPWGVVARRARPTTECFIAADLDLAAQERGPRRRCPRSPTGRPAGLPLAAEVAQAVTA